MKVKILEYTPNGEQLVASAAKLCYSPVGVDEITEDLTPENTENFLKGLVGVGHFSPIEHVSFTFAVEGISRVLTHQLVRHRLASYSQQSQRYVKLDDFQSIIPPTIAENEEAKKIFLDTIKQDQEAYLKIAKLLEEDRKQELIDSGMSEEEAERKSEKYAIEDARYVFPNACETKIVLTMNARNLHHFFSLRCCQRAQWEIRALAIEMLRQCKAIYPTLFKNAGPGCVNGPCPEGKMSCGRQAEIRQFFREEL